MQNLLFHSDTRQLLCKLSKIDELPGLYKRSFFFLRNSNCQSPYIHSHSTVVHTEYTSIANDSNGHEARKATLSEQRGKSVTRSKREQKSLTALLLLIGSIRRATCSSQQLTILYIYVYIYASTTTTSFCLFLRFSILTLSEDHLFTFLTPILRLDTKDFTLDTLVSLGR